MCFPRNGDRDSIQEGWQNCFDSSKEWKLKGGIKESSPFLVLRGQGRKGRFVGPPEAQTDLPPATHDHVGHLLPLSFKFSTFEWEFPNNFYVAINHLRAFYRKAICVITELILCSRCHSHLRSFLRETRPSADQSEVLILAENPSNRHRKSTAPLKLVVSVGGAQWWGKPTSGF